MSENSLRAQVLDKLAKEDGVDNWKEWKKASILFGEDTTVKKIERAVDLALAAAAEEAERAISTMEQVKKMKCAEDADELEDIIDFLRRRLVGKKPEAGKE